MSTKKRVIGISAAATEAARRHLMQPVTCWEQAWVPLENASHIKIYKWVKSDKVQQFIDDEGNVDEPLAPLPDDQEQEGDVIEVEGDEEGMAVDPENAAPDALAAEDKPDESAIPSTIASETREASEAVVDSSKPASPVLNANPLSMGTPLDQFDGDGNDDLEPGPSAHEGEDTTTVSGPSLTLDMGDASLGVADPEESAGLVLGSAVDMPHPSLGVGGPEAGMDVDMSGIVTGDLEFVGEVPPAEEPPIEGVEGLLDSVLDAPIDSFSAEKEAES